MGARDKRSVVCLQYIQLDPKFLFIKSRCWGVSISFNSNFEFKVNRYNKDKHDHDMGLIV